MDTHALDRAIMQIVREESRKKVPEIIASHSHDAAAQKVVDMLQYSASLRTKSQSVIDSGQPTTDPDVVRVLDIYRTIAADDPLTIPVFVDDDDGVDEDQCEE